MNGDRSWAAKYQIASEDESNRLCYSQFVIHMPYVNDSSAKINVTVELELIKLFARSFGVVLCKSFSSVR